MIYITLLSAILLSGIAAYYSIIGLAAIFTGAFWPIVFMGSVLELSKLVTTSWLYRNWKTCPILLKTYLTTAVVILMLITSMGIFGFLSKSHIDSTLDAGANSVEIKTLTQQEKITKERLEYLLARAKDPSTASNKLDRQIQDTQKELKEIANKKLPLLREENKLIAEVGPIKYVGEMVYGSEDDNAIDKAVRLVIMLIMVVFDPLAVLLLIAANMSMKKPEVEEEIKEETPDPYVADVGEKPTEEELQPEVILTEEKIIEMANEINDKIQELNNNIAKMNENKDESTINVDKENVTTIEENKPEPFAYDPVTDEEVVLEPVRREEHHAPGVYTEHHEVIEVKKKLEPKYDYTAEYAFKEKEK